MGSYALGFDSGKKIASKMLTAQFFDLPPSHFDKRNSYIEAITLEDVRRVARRLLKPDQLIITAVGEKNTTQSRSLFTLSIAVLVFRQMPSLLQSHLHFSE